MGWRARSADTASIAAECTNKGIAHALKPQKGHLKEKVAFLLASHTGPDDDRDPFVDLRTLRCPGLVASSELLVLPRARATANV